MRWFVDTAYLIFLCLTWPLLLVNMIRRGTLRTDWSACGPAVCQPRQGEPVMLGVSCCMPSQLVR